MGTAMPCRHTPPASLTRCTTAQLPAEWRAVLARGVGMRTGDLYRLDQGPLLPAPVERADRRSGIGVSRMTDGRLGYWAAPAGRGGRLGHRGHCCPTGLSGRVSAGFFGHATDSLAT